MSEALAEALITARMQLEYLNSKQSLHPISSVVGKCSVPMWMGGCPAGQCGETAYGVYIDGPTFRDGWTGEVVRRDGKFRGYVPDLACPKHGGPDATGARVFQDGYSESGRPMWCAVFHDFENLQESPAQFDERPWVAIQKLKQAQPAA